jgi:hypothetical protein
MKGILNENFSLVTISDKEIEIGEAEFCEEDVFGIKKGETVEILKVIESAHFLDGKGYVVFSPNNFESITLASIFVDVIEE